MNDNLMICDMLEEFRKTRSITLACAICDRLNDELPAAAKEINSEPTIHETEQA